MKRPRSSPPENQVGSRYNARVCEQNISPERRTQRNISFQNTKSGAGEQFLLQDCRARACAKGVFFHRHPCSRRFHPLEMRCRPEAEQETCKILMEKSTILHVYFACVFAMIIIIAVFVFFSERLSIADSREGQLLVLDLGGLLRGEREDRRQDLLRVLVVDHLRWHQTCDFCEHATSAPAELGREIHNVSRNRATKVLLQAQKLHVYGSGTLGAFGQRAALLFMCLFYHYQHD